MPAWCSPDCRRYSAFDGPPQGGNRNLNILEYTYRHVFPNVQLLFCSRPMMTAWKLSRAESTNACASFAVLRYPLIAAAATCMWVVGPMVLRYHHHYRLKPARRFMFLELELLADRYPSATSKGSHDHLLRKASTGGWRTGRLRFEVPRYHRCRLYVHS